MLKEFIMELYAIDDCGNKRKIKDIFKGGPDGTPIKLEKGSKEFMDAISYAIKLGKIVIE
jgi:hypothetical protein